MPNFTRRDGPTAAQLRLVKHYYRLTVNETLSRFFGFAPLGSTSYLTPGRLEDVIALIQILALDPLAHRDEENLAKELQGSPQSESTWTCLAERHPEFFRVKREGLNRVSLVARHATLRDTNDRRAPLDPDFTQGLLSTAIELHDRQLKRSERWVPLIPLWTAALTGGIAIVVALIAAVVALCTHS